MKFIFCAALCFVAVKAQRAFLASVLATAVACAIISCQSSGDNASKHTGDTFAASSAWCAAEAGSVLDSAMPSSYDFFADELLVMNEVRLCPRIGDIGEAYRVFGVRSFYHPVLVTLNRIAQTTHLRYKEWDGAGGYQLGRLIVDTTVDLTDAQWTTLSDLASATGIWAEAGQNSRTEAGIDGAIWAIEGVRNSRYGLIYAHSPNDSEHRPEVARFGIAILKAAGRLPARDLY